MKPIVHHLVTDVNVAGFSQLRPKVMVASALSLGDVRTTKRSCCLVAACGHQELCSELKQPACELSFLFYQTLLCQPGTNKTLSIFRDCHVFLAVQSSMPDFHKAEFLQRS